jgi:hypothetical protein
MRSLVSSDVPSTCCGGVSDLVCFFMKRTFFCRLLLPSCYQYTLPAAACCTTLLSLLVCLFFFFRSYSFWPPRCVSSTRTSFLFVFFGRTRLQNVLRLTTYYYYYLLLITKYVVLVRLRRTASAYLQRQNSSFSISIIAINILLL